MAHAAADHSRQGWLTPGVRGVGLASLLSDLGHEVPTALLPGLLTSTLGAPASALGLVEGVADGVSGAARLAGGALADDPGRRRTVAVGGYTTGLRLRPVLRGRLGPLLAGMAAFEAGSVTATLLILRGHRAADPRARHRRRDAPRPGAVCVLQHLRHRGVDSGRAARRPPRPTRPGPRPRRRGRPCSASPTPTRAVST